MVEKIKIGIVGGTGYVGVELLRLLVMHPYVSLTCVTSRAEVGLKVSDVFPSLRGVVDLAFTDPASSDLLSCDLVFFASPHGVAMQHAPALLEAGIRVIDLGADFRVQDITLWEKWYGMTHACPEWVQKAVYGLPEMNRAAIQSAQLIANPGCYATAVQLGFLPLLRQGVVDRATLIADAKSGVSGAGRKADVGILYAEVADNFKAYSAAGHRHLPEITQGMSQAAGQPVKITFVPHLIPCSRGIHATLYATLTQDVEVQTLFEHFYMQEPFVDILPPGSHPGTRSVRGSNLCRMAVSRPQTGDTVVVLSVIDNLVKGAGGQAIHNMNLMLGWPEMTGLALVPFSP